MSCVEKAGDEASPPAIPSAHSCMGSFLECRISKEYAGGGCRALLTCYHEGCHNSNCQGCSVVYEDLREEVSKGQKEGKERDVIEPVEEQKKSKLPYHTMCLNMAEWKKRQT